MSTYVSFKKKIAKRKYQERVQPEWRKDKGFLEKKVDYKKRANYFNQKRDTMNKLKQKAELKNEDEFYFKMQNSKIDNKGDLIIKDLKGKVEDPELYKHVLKTKNQNVVKLHLYRLSYLKRKQNRKNERKSIIFGI